MEHFIKYSASIIYTYTQSKLFSPFHRKFLIDSLHINIDKYRYIFVNTEMYKIQINLHANPKTFFI